MKICEVCLEKTFDLVAVADRNTASFLFICSVCVDLYQEEHYEDIFRSPVDFDLVNADRRRLRQVA